MIIHSLHFIHIVICFFIKRILFNYSSQIIVKHTPIESTPSAMAVQTESNKRQYVRNLLNILFFHTAI